MQKVISGILMAVAAALVLAACSPQQAVESTYNAQTPESVPTYSTETVDASQASQANLSAGYEEAYSKIESDLSLLEQNDYYAQETMRQLRPIGRETAIGDIVTFGNYTWLVLDIQDSYAFLLSELILARMHYHNVSQNITWENTSIRQYLNNEFFERFSDEQRSRIRETELINHSNPWFETDGGNNTVDKVFLLSLNEVIEFFGDSGQLADRNHPNNRSWGFADQYGTYRIAWCALGRRYGWWLRTPGLNPNEAVVVYQIGGDILVRGTDVNVFFPTPEGGSPIMDSRMGGLRPALWLSIE